MTRIYTRTNKHCEASLPVPVIRSLERCQLLFLWQGAGWSSRPKYSCTAPELNCSTSSSRRWVCDTAGLGQSGGANDAIPPELAHLAALRPLDTGNISNASFGRTDRGPRTSQDLSGTEMYAQANNLASSQGSLAVTASRDVESTTRSSKKSAESSSPVASGPPSPPAEPEVGSLLIASAALQFRFQRSVYQVSHKQPCFLIRMSQACGVPSFVRERMWKSQSQNQLNNCVIRGLCTLCGVQHLEGNVFLEEL